MTCTTVRTQQELDQALAADDVTCIHIESPSGVWLRLSSFGSATVRASGSATVEAFDSATVRASGSATVEAFDSATVEAFDSATVEASGSTGVHAHGASTTTATPHVAVHLHSARATVDGGILIDLTRLDLADARTWAEHHGANVDNGQITLYKALDDDLTTGVDYGHEVVWTVGTELTAPDWQDSHHCGGGLHLSPTTHQATDYRYDATRWMRCTAAIEDVRPINDGGTAKAKARMVRVEAEVDRYGRDLAPGTPAVTE